MARPRSRVLDYLVAVAIRGVICVVQALDWDSAYELADFFAWLAHRFDRRHREVALENLRHAFPEWTELRRDRVVRDTYRHFCAMVVEMIRGPRALRQRNLGTFFRFQSEAVRQRIETALFSKRPLLILSGHHGNWEVYGYALGLWGAKLSAVARPLDNPHLDELLNRFRGSTGQRMIAKNGELDRINALMSAGGNLVLLADQDAGQKGLFVEYFGRPASTHKSIALLAMEYDVLTVIGSAIRVGRPLRYEVVVEDFIEPSEFASSPDALKRFTQRFTSALERLVRRAPEQYLWLHRRWKHRPIERKAKKSAAA
jgi:Kdo2-lipid IVA lauroyltransferase/acyltransferase